MENQMYNIIINRKGMKEYHYYYSEDEYNFWLKVFINRFERHYTVNVTQRKKSTSSISN